MAITKEDINEIAKKYQKENIVEYLKEMKGKDTNTIFANKDIGGFNQKVTFLKNLRYLAETWSSA